METPFFTKCLFEFIGTLVLILMGDGVVANNTTDINTFCIIFSICITFFIIFMYNLLCLIWYDTF